MSGIIALDIDGTVTATYNEMTPEVAAYLEQLVKEGWQLIFITGRTFDWGYKVLQQLNVPYYFAIQNGAIVMEMPSQKIIARNYLDHSILPILDEISLDYAIYLGFENNDKILYRRKHFSPETLEYIDKRKAANGEDWNDVDDFDTVPQQFTCIKYFGADLHSIVSKIEQRLGLHIPIIKDPFFPNICIGLGTHPEATKGNALGSFPRNGPVIAAGDDNNDRSMLEKADIKVVMATAPRDMLMIADVIAPPADQNGIIQGLQHAIAMVGKR